MIVLISQINPISRLLCKSLCKLFMLFQMLSDHLERNVIKQLFINNYQAYMYGYNFFFSFQLLWVLMLEDISC